MLARQLAAEACAKEIEELTLENRAVGLESGFCLGSERPEPVQRPPSAVFGQKSVGGM